MKILVTGGTGFVGSNLVAALVKRGDTVRVLRRASSSLTALDGLQIEHIIGDILDADAVARAVEGCDIVFHVAALAAYWRLEQEPCALNVLRYDRERRAFTVPVVNDAAHLASVP